MKAGESTGYTPIAAREAFLAVHGGSVTFSRIADKVGYYGERTAKGVITVYGDAAGNIEGNHMWAKHEMFHDFNANAILAGKTLGQPYLDLEANPIFVDGVQISAGNGVPRTAAGYRPGEGGSSRTPYRNSFAGRDGVAGEDFADMGANWVSNSFMDDTAGRARYNWMENRMSGWIALAVAHNR